MLKIIFKKKLWKDLEKNRKKINIFIPQKPINESASSEVCDSGLGDHEKSHEILRRKIPRPRLILDNLTPFDRQIPLPRPMLNFSPLKASPMKQSPLKNSPRPKFFHKSLPQSTPSKVSPPKFAPNLTPIKRDRKWAFSKFWNFF